MQLKYPINRERERKKKRYDKWNVDIGGGKFS